MKLLYLTNVKMPADNAQSLQVKSMAMAFNVELKNNFALISPQSKNNENIVSDYRWKKISVPDYLPRFLRYVILILKSSKIVREIKPDFIYTRDIGIAFIYKLLGFQTVYEIHKPFEMKIGDFIFKIISRNIKTVAISEALKYFVMEKYNLKESDILVVHDGVFLEDYTRIKNPKEELKKEYLNLDKDKFAVLYSGSLQKGKGMELILAAAEKMSEVVFVVVGWKDKEVDSMVKILPNLIFMGKKTQDDLPFYLKSADLLILPFTKELKTWKYHSALKMFEYMASGVPILASKLGSIEEVLNKNNSFLFNSENVDDFVNKINYIKNNYKEAEYKAVIALGDVKKYDWQNRAINILNFIK